MILLMWKRTFDISVICDVRLRPYVPRGRWSGGADVRCWLQLPPRDNTCIFTLIFHRRSTDPLKGVVIVANTDPEVYITRPITNSRCTETNGAGSGCVEPNGAAAEMQSVMRNYRRNSAK